MSEDPQRIDPISAENLIRGARSGSPVEPDTLAGLLAAAAGPAREDELAGEENAVAAFRHARRTLGRRPRRRFMLKSVLARASIVAAVAVAGGGGVALAASTGHLPGTGSPEEHASARSTHATTGATASHASPPATGTHGAAASHTAPSGSPAPNMRGLCTAFRAHGSDNPGKALEDPAFKALITRAGGKDKVAGYCATVLSTPSGKASGHHGDASTHAPSHPSSHGPSAHPTKPRPGHSAPSHPAPSTSNHRR
ncbi:MAG: hypothetical protein J2P14_11025 [Acidothermales bacterium]|nr:hypothetical protein [Acidothermales bacterium]